LFLSLVVAPIDLCVSHRLKKAHGIFPNGAQRVFKMERKRFGPLVESSPGMFVGKSKKVKEATNQAILLEAFCPRSKQATKKDAT